MRFLLLLLCATPVAWCYPPHPAVVAARHDEEKLPHHLRSPALHNPNLQEILPLTSLLHKGEQLVYQREADDVSRREIYNILTHAGFLPRNPQLHPLAMKIRNNPHPPQNFNHLPQNFNHHAQIFNHFNSFNLPYLGNPELLQHL